MASLLGWMLPSGKFIDVPHGKHFSDTTLKEICLQAAPERAEDINKLHSRDLMDLPYDLGCIHVTHFGDEVLAEGTPDANDRLRKELEDLAIERGFTEDVKFYIPYWRKK